MFCQYPLSLSFICCAFLFFGSCQKEVLSSNEYPVVRTLAVTGISAKGAVFEGEILGPGAKETLEHGFVWGYEDEPSPTVELSERKLLTNSISSGKFNSTIGYNLEANHLYNVRAFARTEDYIVYGQMLVFKSLGSQAPEVTGIEPATGVWGDTIKIKGRGFSYRSTGNQVYFGKVSAIVDFVSDSLLMAIVPSVVNEEKVNISVAVTGNTVVSTQSFLYQQPKLSNYFPKEGVLFDTITIHGESLSRSPTTKVWFNEHLAHVIKRSHTEIKVLVPPFVTEEFNKIIVESSGIRKTTEGIFHYLPPVITSFSPDTLRNPDRLVTINGSNFYSFNLYENQVLVGGNRATIIKASKNEITFEIPADFIRENEEPLYTKAEIKIKIQNFESVAKKELVIY